MKRILFLALFLAAGILSAWSQGALDLNSKIPFDKKIITGKLDNGMTYYIVKNDNPKNRAELSIAVKAGSIDEDEDQLGLAHFCEHMAFNGTKNFPKHELVNYLESIGMKFGAEVNAFTSFDQTVYGITVPLDSMPILDKGLLVIYDWACNVSYEGEEIDKERGVIHEEWRMGRGAQDRMMQKYLPVIFHNSKFAKRLPIGTMDIVDKCPHDALKRFYRDWYRPDLMAVIAVGDFDEKMMEQKIKDVFSKIPKATNPRKKENADIPDHDDILISIVTDKEAPMTTAQLFYKHPEFKQVTVKDYRTSLAQNLFSMMISKRLQELTLLATPPFMQAACMYTKFLGPKDIYISFALTQNTGLEKGLETIVEENERVKRFGFTQTELDREKKSFLKEVEKQYNERNKRKSQSILSELRGHFMDQDPLPGLEVDWELCQKYIPDIKLEDVNALAKQWITDKNLVAVIMAPEKDDVKVPTEAKVKEIITTVKNKDLKPYEDKVITKPLVSKEPTPGNVAKKTENKKLGYSEWTLNNGIKVILKNTDFKQDEIQFSAFSKGGWSNNKDQDAVAAEIAADVISESGLGEFDNMELDKYLSDKTVNVTPFINETDEGMNGSCTPKDFETLLQLTYLYFTAPRKDETAFTSYINKSKGMLENNSTNPEMVWRDSITTTMSVNHPRKKPMTIKRLEEAKLGRVDYVYKQRFGDPSNFTFVFVGNIDQKIAEPLIAKYIGGLPEVKREESFKDLNVGMPKGIVDKKVLKGKEDKSFVYMSFPGNFEWNQKNKIEIEVLSLILNIKLIETIREDKSGVYTISSYPQLTHYPNGKYNFLIFFPCSPDNIDRLSEGVMAEIEKLRKDGPTEIDLNKAKEQKLRDRETNLRENNYWLNTLKGFYFHGDSPDGFSDFEQTVKSLTVAKIKEAATKYLDPKNRVRVMLKPENL
ncbi:MAG: hypothetical protein A2275_14780 [Bacteroidetes bacterium RIFOXYA12_FULL_35_11]|nr:MAG: hypothetical protein A2X01_07640 [Bacteroidetes bacterium GWF2_35_48]OFY73253.1 MAG: hypothetical protein A2275_14780 [Bacteroidetes bacterium RIFOXYA12_FULL_35_11]OFY94021.1 MAG: hypothetical protein A2491_17025 [Bacteroidetes bacterium RIFOXYC12_FULL_35_7]OFY97642.1 MAG: hypothetical protein A2309_11710 [Bacteroidetes bacterium RIFOXYB2_FULL_35_7]HBX52926.1 hypothetical protein [Bacteroidales bacterium]